MSLSCTADMSFESNADLVFSMCRCFALSEPFETTELPWGLLFFSKVLARTLRAFVAQLPGS